MCIHMYIHICIYVYIHTYVYTYVNTYMYICVCIYTYICVYIHTHTHLYGIGAKFFLGPFSPIFRDKGELRGGEVPEQSRRFSLRIRQEVFHGSVTSMQLLQNPDDHMVHSERLPSSQNPSLLGPDVTLKSTSSRLLFYK